jgi:hypothetical protein
MKNDSVDEKNMKAPDREAPLAGHGGAITGFFKIRE